MARKVQLVDLATQSIYPYVQFESVVNESNQPVLKSAATRSEGDFISSTMTAVTAQTNRFISGARITDGKLVFSTAVPTAVASATYAETAGKLTNKLTFTGAVSGVYDGSSGLALNIPVIAGPKGDKGDKGDTGPAGSTGPIGGTGAQGPVGPYYIPTVNATTGLLTWGKSLSSIPTIDSVNIKGPKGDKGDPGAAAAKGDPGPAGPKGDKGDKGDPGDKGDNGVNFIPSVNISGVLSWTNNGGLANPSAVSIKGPQGDIGPQGPKGDTGARGLQGPQGDTGATGARGADGAKGDAGGYYRPSLDSNGNLTWTAFNGAPVTTTGNGNIRGATGPQGAKGADGAPGATGAKGDKGAKGDTGGYYTPTVNASGLLSWNAQNGAPTLSTTVNIKGPAGTNGEKGDKGDKGDKGPSGTLSYGGSGNIVVGTGTQAINTLSYVNGAHIDASGKITASSFWESSDETLKNFTDDVEVNFEELKGIPKKKFTWKEDESAVEEIGTSAQEVQKLYPELVSEKEDGTLTVNYAKLSIVALSAIDKLYDRIIMLENEIKDLKTRG